MKFRECLTENHNFIYSANKSRPVSNKYQLSNMMDDNCGPSMIDTPKEHLDAITSYTKGTSKSKGWSHKLNAALGKGKPVPVTHKAMHEAIHTYAKPVGMDVHVYSGVQRDYGDIAKKSVNGIVHVPPHISATIDPNISLHHASDFMRKDHTEPLHVMNIKLKPENKAIYVDQISKFRGEGETVIPSGAKLKYSHTTVHDYDAGDNRFTGSDYPYVVHEHHFTIHSQE